MIPEETGFLVPVGDGVAFARKSLKILDDAIAHRLGQAGRARIEQHFTVEQMIAGHVAMYG